MKDERSKPRWSLPYSSPLPESPAARRWATAARIGAYALFAAVLVGVVAQVQYLTMKNVRKGEAWDREHLGLTLREAVALGRPKAHRGALGRWRLAIHQFWDGQNIYRAVSQGGDAQRPPDTGTPTVWLHPNMPFTVVLLSPLAYLPVGAMTLTWNVLKVLMLLATLLMLADLGRHGERRLGDWVLGLGLLWAIMFVIGDIQHGNTNVFVLGAITLHLWLYRKGHDAWAGASLALAICLKMTPALFVLYWLYQRNWKLLAGTLAAGVVFVFVVPMTALSIAFGPEHYFRLTATWLDNLILPGLVKGAWYPIHINQSISGVMSRYFLSEPSPNGNIFWNPDDAPYSSQVRFQWIALASLGEATVKWIIRACQVVVVGLMAWAIGWRKLPRDDGRRLLHYGLVALGMLLLNQRTWDHHAAVLLIASVGVWRAIAHGRAPSRRRAWALGMMLAAGLLVWLTGTDLFVLLARAAGLGKEAGGHWADVFDAYGPTFLYFVLLLAAAAALAAGLKGSGDPFAEERQKLWS